MPVTQQLEEGCVCQAYNSHEDFVYFSPALMVCVPTCLLKHFLPHCLHYPKLNPLLFSWIGLFTVCGMWFRIVLDIALNINEFSRILEH